MKLKCFIMSQILFYSFLGFAQSAPKTQVVVYPKREMSVDRRLEFHLAVLQLALGYFPGKYVIQSSDSVIPQSRRFLDLMSKDSKLSLTWSMTTEERETSGVIPVRFPIDQGLLGLRVLLIRKEQQPYFEKLKPTDLKKLKIGLQHDWPDRKIFEEAGYSVIAGPMYESLFPMLIAKRFDAFPRSVLEVSKEQATYRDQGLVVEKKWLFRYPTANYFFVSPAKPDLARDIENGLLRAQQEGKFQALIKSYFESELGALSLKTRTIVDLNNSLLPKVKVVKGYESWHSLSKSW